MMLTIRVEQEFGLNTPIDIPHALIMFDEVCNNLNLMLDTKKVWYEKGFSRKQASQHRLFSDAVISEAVQSRWEKRYKKIIHFLVRVFGMVDLMKIVQGSI